MENVYVFTEISTIIKEVKNNWAPACKVLIEMEFVGRNTPIVSDISNARLVMLVSRNQYFTEKGLDTAFFFSLHMKNEGRETLTMTKQRFFTDEYLGFPKI